MGLRDNSLFLLKTLPHWTNTKCTLAHFTVSQLWSVGTPSHIGQTGSIPMQSRNESFCRHLFTFPGVVFFCQYVRYTNQPSAQPVTVEVILQYSRAISDTTITNHTIDDTGSQSLAQCHCHQADDV